MKTSDNNNQKDCFFSMTWDFLNTYVPQDSSSRQTVKTYRNGLTVFRRYISSVRHIPMKDFTFDMCTFDLVLDYRNWLHDDQKRKESTVNNRLAAIKSYLCYAAGRDIRIQQIQLNVSAVPFMRVPRRIRPVISNTDTLRAFLDAPPNTHTGCRDTMILSLLYDTMIRADELIRLKLRDVHTDSDTPYLFIHGKGNKERTVPVSGPVIPLIDAFMKEFHADGDSPDAPFVYTAIHGRRNMMSERNVERIVKKYADQIRAEHPDLPDTVYPHMLRRTRGTGLYQDGVAIEAITVAMGHASIQTTKDHYAFPSLEQKRTAMEQGGGIAVKNSTGQEWPDDEDEFARLCGL